MIFKTPTKAPKQQMLKKMKPMKAIKMKTRLKKISGPTMTVQGARAPKMGGALSNRDVSLMKKAAPRAKMGAMSNKDMSMMKKKLPKYR